MIILNAGVPRSGTVLVNAILRALFKGASMSTAQSNPHGAELPRVVRHLQRTGQDRFRNVILHTHSWDLETEGLLAGSPFVTGFINYRDPRDVCVSLMRLHDHDFDTAAEMTESAFSVFERTAHALDLTVLPYELLTADRRGHIFQIARRLGLWPGMDEVARIDEDTSVDRHRAVMEKVQSGSLDNLERRRNRNRVLVEDPKTLINDRHIQSGASGRWRAELSDDQQHVANERFGALLTRYGYPV